MTHFLMQTILLPNSEPIESDLLARAVISKHEQTSDKSEQLYTFLRRIFSDCLTVSPFDTKDMEA